MTDEQVQVALQVARAVARRYWWQRWVTATGLVYDDLVQVAMIGALHGHQTFDPARSSYSTWLSRYIRGEIAHTLRDSRMIRIPRPEYEGRRPRRMDYHVASLDAELVDHDFSEGLPRTLAANLVDRTADTTAGPEIRDLLTRLPQRDAQLLWLYHAQGLTQMELAERFGTSQKHISRLLARGREQLRGMVTA